MAKIKLENVIEQIEFATDLNNSVFHKITGAIYLIPEEVLRFVESDDEDDEFISEWEKELIPIAKDILENPDNYLSFPNQFDIHEYSIMERYCLSIVNEELREKMYSSIKGSGAFQRFKKNIDLYGIANEWYKFKDEAYKEIAIEWCEINNLEYC